jgi:PAS domain S-box-containing protein
MNGTPSPGAGASEPATPLGFLAGGGDMGARLRAFDWIAHPLGPPQEWPASLQTAVRIMLAARQPIWIGWGPQLHYLYNDPYKAIIGGKHPAMLGQPTATVWREIWEDIAPLLERAMRGDEGTYVEGQLLIMERSGYREETYYTFSYTPIPDGDRVGGIICFNTDDTRRVIGERQLTLLRDLGAAVAELRSAQDVWQRAAAVLAGNPRDLPFVLCYELDAAGHEAKLAAAAGIAAGSAAAPPVLDLRQPDAPWPLARVVAERQPVLVARAELPGPLPSGAWAEPPHAAVVVPVLTEAARCAGALVFGLSPFRLLDSDYRGFVTLVTDQVTASLGRALAYEQARARADALAALDRAKTAFFSNVSHELRTPLTLILSPLDDALGGRHGDLPAAAADELAMARRSAHRLLKLVNTLLDFSRIEAGRVRASFAPTDLARATADLASSFRAAFERAGLRLDVDCPPTSQPVHVDRDMWEKVVLNLLSNAFKHTFDGGVRVALREHRGAAAGSDHVELTVADTGTGIPPDAMPRVFERFFRVDGARGRTHEGTGIGLALVRDLVELHGGAVSADSELGRGSTFTVTIPLGTAHLPPEHVVRDGAASPRAVRIESYLEELASWQGDAGAAAAAGADADAGSVAGRASRSELAGARVLVADDNADLRGYLARVLTAAGYGVQTAGDGEAALAAIERQPPELLVTDVMMPRLDGLQLLRALRQRPDTAALPVIVLSARAGEEAMVAGLEVGADDYLFKPFSARELLARVESQIRLARTRRAAELASWHEREQLHTVLESIQDSFLAIDRDWRLTWANGVALRAMRTTAADVVGKVVWDALPRLTGSALDHVYRRAMAGEAMRVELQGPLTGRWFDVAVTPTPEGIAVCARDVTALRESAAAVVASEQRLRSVTDALPVLISYIDADERYRYHNRAYERWFGHDAAQLAGRTMRDVLGDAAYERLRPAVLRALAGDDVSFEAEIPYRHGGTRHIDGTYVPDRDDEGRVRGFYVLVLDVTARKEAELALRESETRFRRMADDTPVMIWVTEPDGTCSYLSRRWYEFTGQTPEHALGLGWLGALHPDDQQRAHATFAEANAGRVPFRLEYRLRRADGQYREAIDSASPRLAPDGAFLGYIGSVMDVTELREAERLQSRLLEREREARVAAETSTRLKDEFLATLSHELRTPLNAILGWTRLLRDDLHDPAKAAQALAVIERNARAQSQLVADMLDMSRILAGKMRIAPRPVDLATVVGAAVDTVRPAADAKGVALALTQPPRAVVVDADPERLQQVVWNLLSNAVKFTPRGGRVDVTVQLVAESARVRVADDGEGISPEFLPRLFGRFNQADGSTSRPHGGLGIGLALVKELVELHGGTVHVASEGVGRGAVFIVDLPAAGAAREPTVPPRRDGDRDGGVSSHAVPPARIDLTGVRVLAVEDDPDALALVLRMLGECGASVTPARSGDEALAALAHATFDVLVSDIGMSPMDGYTLLGEVRRRGITTPALALTAFARPVDRTRAQMSGYHAHLPKPLSAAELAAAVAAAVGRQRPAGTGGDATGAEASS